MLASDLLRKAKSITVQYAQTQLSRLIQSKSSSMIVSQGKPVSFLIPYEDMLDLVETLDELTDNKFLEEIKRARKEYVKGKTVPAEQLLNIPLHSNDHCR